MSDNESFFLHALLLDGKGGATRVDDGAVQSWAPDQGAIWTHLDVNNPAAQQWLMAQEDVPDAVIDALLAGESRPWTAVSEGSLSANLRGVNTNPAANPEDMVSVRIWITRDRIISSRRRRLLAVTDIVQDLDEGKGPDDPSELFAVLVEKLSDRIGAFVDLIEERVDRSEDDVDSSRLSEFRRELSAVRRQMAAVRRFLAPQRDALDRLNRRQPAVLAEDDALSLIQEADRVTRYLEDIDLARERVVVLQEELLSQIAQEQNSRMYVLSVVAAIFLPLTFITGLLGMNVGGLPGLENPKGFTASIFIMVASAIALLAYFRHKKWL